MDQGSSQRVRGVKVHAFDRETSYLSPQATDNFRWFAVQLSLVSSTAINLEARALFCFMRSTRVAMPQSQNETETALEHRAHGLGVGLRGTEVGHQ